MATTIPKVIERMDPGTPWPKRLIIDPLFESSAERDQTAASIDFHLGTRFSVPRRRRAVLHDPLGLYNAFADNEMVSAARHERDHLQDPDIAAAELFIPLGQKFVLHPGQLVLSTTLEWFRFPSDMMAYVVGRSIWGRRGLLVATATAVQPGSTGTITLELANVGEIAVVLRPGAAIGQIFFHEIADASSLGEDSGRRSTFTGAHRPILGRYRRTDTENYLLGVDG
jgi:dCTP deaminase